MKKMAPAIAMLLALLSAPAALLAQDGGTTIELGIKAGVNLATLSGEGDSPGRRTALLAGAHLTIGLPNSMFYFQPEILYSMKGFKESDGGMSATLALNYVDVPVFAGLAFPTGSGRVTPRIFAGPQASFKVSCDLKGSEGGTNASISCDDDLLSGILETKGVVFDLVFGGGLDIAAGKLDIVFDARYDLGLTDALELGDSKNTAWQFLGGVAFPLGN